VALSAPVSAEGHLSQHFATNVFGNSVTGGSGFAGARFNRFACNHDSYDGDRYWNGDHCFPTERGGCN
jgi:hypothetical protein